MIEDQEYLKKLEEINEAFRHLCNIVEEFYGIEGFFGEEWDPDELEEIMKESNKIKVTDDLVKECAEEANRVINPVGPTLEMQNKSVREMWEQCIRRILEYVNERD